MNFFKIADYIRNGKFVMVAITRKCNCRCPACSLWKEEASIDADDFISNIDKLYKSGFRLIEFTGGEPLLHPGLFDMIEAAEDMGMFVQLMSNGTLINKENIKKMKDKGVKLLNISVDHYKDKISSNYRGFDNINKRVENSVDLAKKQGIFTSSTTLITKYNVKDIGGVIDYVNKDLGIPFSFCTPEVSENFPLSGGNNDVLPEKEEILEALDKILEKKKEGAEIMNSALFINELKRWIKGEEVKYDCRAGEDIVYVDWNMDIFRCFRKEKLGNLRHTEENFLKKPRCNECSLQCFREPSLYYYKGGKIELMKDYKIFIKALNESGILN